MIDNRPIGVFDSGIGGLTVLKELKSHFPHESFIYLGDTARLPYGTKSPETVRKYSEQNIDFLQHLNVKTVVIACNTASSYFMEHQFHNLPIYNVIEPGAARARHLTQCKRIGVLGTRTTISSESYVKALHKLDPDLKVFQQVCPLFVPLAEEGWVDDPITNLIAYRYINIILSSGIDSLILGCTHYPILKNSIRKVVGPNIELIDSGEAIALLLEEDLKREILKPADKNKTGTIEILTTDISEHLKNMALRILDPFEVQSFKYVDISKYS